MADWKAQSLQVWNKISKRQRYTIVGAAVFVLVAILGWSYWLGNKPDMVPLFTGMEAKDAGEVAAKLKEMKIAFEPQETPNGTAIMVQSKDVHGARLELATLGLPRGQKGFEIFEGSKMGVTEFQNKVNYLQALQGELTRTIEQLAAIEKARVHIVLPEDSLYKKNEKPATASIMLKLKPEQQLSKKEIKGIVNLTAHSIQGLQPENITIVDAKGRILNDPDDEEELEKNVSAVTITQMDMTKKVQDRLQRDVQTLLDQALGQGKSYVRLNVELNFDQRSMDRQTFAPVVDDAGIVRSSQELNENYSGTAAAPGGPAGTASNIPGYVTQNNNTESQYEKKEVTKNYEINETKEKVVAAPGSVRRLTVAVLVDEQITRTQQESLVRAVSSAIGLNTTRGDTISVEAIPFSTELADRQAREEQAAQAQEDQMMWIGVGLGALLIAIVLLVLYLRRRKARLEAQAAAEAEAEAIAVAEKEAREIGEMQMAAGETMGEISPEEQARMDERQILDEMIKTRPDEVAQLVRTWLADE